MLKIGPQAQLVQAGVGCDASFGGTHGTVQPTSPLQMGEWLWQFAPCHPSLSHISKHTSHETKCRDPIPLFCVYVCPFDLLT